MIVYALVMTMARFDIGALPMVVCLHVFEFESGMTQVRFQPRHGKYLAAAVENQISLFDVETHTRVQALQGHNHKVQSLSWDPASERLMSVSEDLFWVWAVNNNKWQCISELNCNSSKFHSCVFHPFSPHLLIIGCYQNLELWDMVEKKTISCQHTKGLWLRWLRQPRMAWWLPPTTTSVLRSGSSCLLVCVLFCKASLQSLLLFFLELFLSL